jgi:hypothetical protein
MGGRRESPAFGDDDHEHLHVRSEWIHEKPPDTAVVADEEVRSCPW